MGKEKNEKIVCFSIFLKNKLKFIQNNYYCCALNIIELLSRYKIDNFTSNHSITSWEK